MNARRAAEKRVSCGRAAERITEWRALGERIGLAIGSFDLLDVDQVRILAVARDRADRLVVVVRADAEAATLLGPGRPVLAAEQRGGLIAALRISDLVVIAGDAVSYATLTGAAGAASTWTDVDLSRPGPAPGSVAPPDPAAWDPDHPLGHGDSRDPVARVRARHEKD